ncbi:hypothetical protein [Paenibacillus polymyxa]|uniref:hypothetical protein n=1 Tax=Paenibacillus polymyxa TaxID=1406 RepID=UPI00287FA74D|nr:hypothetical protein [Paenibacillus polymyxa]
MYNKCHHKNSKKKCVPGYDPKTGTSTVTGIIQALNTKLFINGKAVALDNDPVEETEKANIPSNATDVRGDEGGTGHISGNLSTKLFLNGIAVAIVGSGVNTHYGGTTTIAEGSDKMFVSS